MVLGPSGKYDEIGSKSGHGAGGDREGMDANIAMLEKEHEEITKVLIIHVCVHNTAEYH